MIKCSCLIQPTTSNLSICLDIPLSHAGIALVLALAAVVTLAVALGFSLSGADKQSSKGSDVEICMTASCVEAAAFILQNINPEIDPCNDFYNFTCGKWAMKNIVPAGICTN